MRAPPARPHAHCRSRCGRPIAISPLYAVRSQKVHRCIMGRSTYRARRRCRRGLVDGSWHLQVTRCFAWDRCQHQCCITWRSADASTTPLGQLCLAVTTVGAALHMCEAVSLSYVVLDRCHASSSAGCGEVRLLGGPDGDRVPHGLARLSCARRKLRVHRAGSPSPYESGERSGGRITSVTEALYAVARVWPTQ